MRIMYGIVRWTAIVLFVLLVSAVFASVAVRYLGVLSGSIDWVEEAARFLFIWVTFLGTALAFNSGSHIRIDILERFVPARVRIALELFVDASVFAFAALLIYYGYDLTVRTIDQISLVLKVSMAIVHVVVPLSGTVILLGALQRLFGRISTLRAT